MQKQLEKHTILRLKDETNLPKDHINIQDENFNLSTAFLETQNFNTVKGSHLALSTMTSHTRYQDRI